MQRRPPAQPQNMTCWLCGRQFLATGKKANRICGEGRCRQVRDIVAGIVRRRREEAEAEGKCGQAGCGKKPRPGFAYCEDHVHRKQPCRRCGERKVKRNAGQGGQPELCDDCRGRPSSLSVVHDGDGAAA